MTTLQELKLALEQPFPVDLVQFLLKDTRHESGKWTCLALPYCNKRVYEDRLNAIAYGEWHTHYVTPYMHANKLIIPTTLTICGVTHTDYGESFLTVPSRNGAVREDENSATEAYSQGFRRACAQFLLGRYLYNLGKLRLPYDPEHKRLVITRGEHIAWVEKLYMDAGLQPRPQGGAKSVDKRVILPALPASQVPQQVVSSSQATHQKAISAATPIPSIRSNSTQQASQPSVPSEPPAIIVPALLTLTVPMSAQSTAYPDNMFLDWVAQQVERDPLRLQGICDFYQVAFLADLNQQQREDITLRLERQQKKAAALQGS